MPERSITVNKTSRAIRFLARAIGRGDDASIMTTPTQNPQLWNDPRDTMPLASFAKKERREIKNERREDTQRATHGERRTSLSRSLRALFRF